MKTIDKDELTSGTFSLLLIALTCAGFFLRVYGLALQPPTGDDIGVALSARNFMECGHLGPIMWNHPVFRNIIVYVTERLFNGSVWGLKAASLFFGSLSVPIVALFALKLFRERGPALITALFLAVDPLHIDYSRQAVHEVYMLFFIAGGCYFAIEFIERKNPLRLVLSGLLFGLGMSSKWYVAMPLTVTFLYVLFSLHADKNRSGSKKTEGLLFTTAALLILPLTVYIFTFIPWFTRGFTLADWLRLQQAMFLESQTHAGYNPYTLELDSRAYLWFIKPVAYADFSFYGGVPTVLLGISNPLTWLPTLPSISWLAYMSFREKRREHIYLCSLFLITYLPFILSARPIWVHTAFSVLPFGFMATSYLLGRAWGTLRSWRLFIVSYLLLVLIVSMPLYLMATGKGYGNPFLNPVVDLYRPLHER